MLRHVGIHSNVLFRGLLRFVAECLIETLAPCSTYSPPVRVHECWKSVLTTYLAARCSMVSRRVVMRQGSNTRFERQAKRICCTLPRFITASQLFGGTIISIRAGRSRTANSRYTAAPSGFVPESSVKHTSSINNILMRVLDDSCM